MRIGIAFVLSVFCVIHLTGYEVAEAKLLKLANTQECFPVWKAALNQPELLLIEDAPKLALSQNEDSQSDVKVWEIEKRVGEICSEQMKSAISILRDRFSSRLLNDPVLRIAFDLPMPSNLSVLADVDKLLSNEIREQLSLLRAVVFKKDDYIKKLHALLDQQKRLKQIIKQQSPRSLKGCIESQSFCFVFDDYDMSMLDGNKILVKEFSSDEGFIQKYRSASEELKDHYGHSKWGCRISFRDCLSVSEMQLKAEISKSFARVQFLHALSGGDLQLSRSKNSDFQAIFDTVDILDGPYGQQIKLHAAKVAKLWKRDFYKAALDSTFHQ